ncbi:hypothetical protein PAMP_024555 [Pampus punctatissimus]
MSHLQREGCWSDDRRLNTGVNTGLLSTSNTPRITEGGWRGSRRSFEALHSSFSLASFYPIYFPSFPSLMSPIISAHLLLSLSLSFLSRESAMRRGFRV